MTAEDRTREQEIRELTEGLRGDAEDDIEDLRRIYEAHVWLLDQLAAEQQRATQAEAHLRAVVEALKQLPSRSHVFGHACCFAEDVYDALRLAEGGRDAE